MYIFFIVLLDTFLFSLTDVVARYNLKRINEPFFKSICHSWILQLIVLKILSYILMLYSLKLATLTYVTIITSGLSIMLAFAFARYLIKDRITKYKLIGCILIMAAITINVMG